MLSSSSLPPLPFLLRLAYISRLFNSYLLSRRIESAKISTTPYDEDTIVRLMTDLYKVMTKPSYIEEMDVVYAPPGGHKVDLS